MDKQERHPDYHTLKAELARYVWRPIKYAPQGRKVLLYWRHIDHIPDIGIYRDGGWWSANQRSVKFSNPTHWTEIPSLPGEADDEDDWEQPSV